MDQCLEQCPKDGGSVAGGSTRLSLKHLAPTLTRWHPPLHPLSQDPKARILSGGSTVPLYSFILGAVACLLAARLARASPSGALHGTCLLSSQQPGTPARDVVPPRRGWQKWVRN